MNKLPENFKLVIPASYEAEVQENLFELGYGWESKGITEIRYGIPFILCSGFGIFELPFDVYMSSTIEEITFHDLININIPKIKDSSFIEILQKCHNRFDEDANYYSDEFINDLAVEIQKEIDRRIEKAIKEIKNE